MQKWVVKRFIKDIEFLKKAKKCLQKNRILNRIRKSQSNITGKCAFLLNKKKLENYADKGWHELEMPKKAQNIIGFQIWLNEVVETGWAVGLALITMYHWITYIKCAMFMIHKFLAWMSKKVIINLKLRLSHQLLSI